MATKKFPSELASRGTVLPTDILLIHNITTGATEKTTVAGLLASFGLTYVGGNLGINLAVSPLKIGVVSGISTNNLSTPVIMIGSDRADYYASIDSIRGADSTHLGLGFSVNNGAGRINAIQIMPAGISEYADNAAASGAGLPAGTLYKTGDILKIVHA